WAILRKAQVDVAHAPVVDAPADEAGKAEFDGFRVADDRLTTLLQDHLQPLLVAAAASRQRVVNALVVGGPLVFGSLLALDLLLVFSTLRPIKQLAVAAEKLAADERPLVPGSHRTDEIGSLARALQDWQAAESMREA